jgi:hypothetical protein
MDWEKRFRAERDYRHTYGCTGRDWLVDDDVLCLDCCGSGYKLYSDTSTWRGGIGGQSMTTDVCNKCWGSGDKTKSWPRHPR